MNKHYIPFAFCAFLSFMALFLLIYTNQSTAWQPVFFSFLPMCFYFSGGMLQTMQREVDALKKELAELKSSTQDK